MTIKDIRKTLIEVIKHLDTYSIHEATALNWQSMAAEVE